MFLYLNLDVFGIRIVRLVCSLTAEKAINDSRSINIVGMNCFRSDSEVEYERQKINWPLKAIPIALLSYLVALSFHCATQHAYVASISRTDTRIDTTRK